MWNKAFFLDRDGTIIMDKGYLDNPDDIEFIEGIPDLLKKIKEKGYLIVIVSNQSGVARGYFDENTVRTVNWALAEKLKAEFDIAIDGIYYCPHHPEYGEQKQCNCRKPKPGMVLKAADELKIDISRSVMVGDKESDHIDLKELDFIKIVKDENWAQDSRLKKYII
ncbi:D-glycero-alpha-D-manno-heptose-1,7-bisphosphate 7-phosphatase [Aminipila terrae]|uniref:D,D-heptose 1,7-bisphosphate phosphatase n=1 Tax=Aminipila terrae TaxID=2697030 RepID=A0A6P1MDV2_9FIRM|nr:HAD family hydrolase [Aminipila terrae]QHI72087.1 D-glycero-beta-D-manno-heptose 1,7-bisphosphate 7-phosphatase [Aminipila terrae]